MVRIIRSKLPLQTASIRIMSPFIIDPVAVLYSRSPDLTKDKLYSTLLHAGTPITRVPIMAKQPLDLYKLFMLVVERGGLVEVS